MTRAPIDLVRDCYRAYETRDRDLLEGVLADDFSFSSPVDPLLDRAAYFERCWPNAQNIGSFDFARLSEGDGTVWVTYDATRTDGSRFRNTEVFEVAEGKIRRTEVFFGWDLESQP